jgi:hypothetical protein
LGYGEAQYYYCMEAFSENDWQRYHWWGKSAARRHTYALMELQAAAQEHLKLLENGEGLVSVLFELGAAFKGHVKATLGEMFGRGADKPVLRQAQQCIELYDSSFSSAKAVIDCWLAVSRRHGVVKDIRLMIARLVWKEPWVWISVGKK